MDKLIIKGAREHNLKNIDLELPRDKLIVISGKSGSGKSSLAFDTIFAEGQRRYVESLSAYARQFLGRLDKPDVDYIEGLSPAISIEQKTTHRNPRSTVGTVTEIYDYYRLFYARIGKPQCPECGRPIEKKTVDQIIDAVASLGEGAKLTLLSPVIRGKKGEHLKVLEDAKRLGYQRARVDGELRTLEEEILLDKKKKHTVEVVVDRLVYSPEQRGRLAEAVEAALSMSEGQVLVLEKTETAENEHFYSEKGSCPVHTEVGFPDLEPRLFSFNNPFGACPACSGLGVTMEFSPELIMPDKRLSFNEGGIVPYNPEANWHRSWFEALSRNLNFSLDTPLEDLPPSVLDSMIHGTDKAIDVVYQNTSGTGKFEYTSQFKGILKDLRRRYHETTSEGIKSWLEKFQVQKPCEECQGRRLKKEALSVYVGGTNIHDLSQMTVADTISFLKGLKLNVNETKIVDQVFKEIQARLGFLASVGLDYLSLERKAGTLSGGEAQRIRLATQIGSQLVGVLYILDEPTIGLHQRDNERLIDTLKHLRDIGNTLIVVEHDEQTIRTADYVVDLGPGSGIHGGYIIAQGTVAEILANPNSITGQYLTGAIQIEDRDERRSGTGQWLELEGATEHNLKGINVKFPVGTLSVITGVSGSGKSTLMSDILYPALVNNLTRESPIPVGAHTKLKGIMNFDKVISIDQSAIGRTPRSNPATYIGVFGAIRDLYATLPESKARGYKPGRFSFNVKGGRCENCEGDGSIQIEMHFLPDVYVTCDVCHGKRFNRETLEVRYKGRNIHEVLEMPVDEAADFFTGITPIAHKLRTLQSVGLGYIKLGQSALTLSGGEAQRVKLSLELSKRSTGKTVYVIDEPTTGLHFADVKQLIEVLQRLVDLGNTVILIEHNLDVIKQSDWIVDLGPEGGARGGQVMVMGTPEDVAAHQSSHTGRFLRELLKTRS
ncbi:MAG: excinuclease ABC subunit UvrA [Spirochaetales bacterium]